MRFDLFNSPVSDIAYRIWELNGKPEGRSEDFWRLAEHVKSMSSEAYMHDCDDQAWSCGGPNGCPYWPGGHGGGPGEYMRMREWLYYGMPLGR